MRAQTLVALVACTIAGCSFPTSRHPLSDENDSRIDPRLYGVWMTVRDPVVTVEGERPNDPAGVIGFGKHAAMENALTCLFTNERTSNAVRHFAIEHTDSENAVFCTPDRKYLSAGSHKDGYWIFRYEFESPGNVLKIRLMSQFRMRRAIESGEITGEIVEPPARALRPGEQPRSQFYDLSRARITITESQKKLHAFLEHNPDAFHDEGLRLRRLSVADVKRLTEIAESDNSAPPRNNIPMLVVGVICGILIGVVTGLWFRRRNGATRIAPDSETSSV